MAPGSDAKFPYRLNLRLSEETYSAYAELARLDGRGVSALVREVLDSAAPEMSLLADALRAALGSVPTEGTDLYSQYMHSLQVRVGVEATRADMWHREVGDLVKTREAERETSAETVP
jgi:hypothetical protein